MTDSSEAWRLRNPGRPFCESDGTPCPAGPTCVYRPRCVFNTKKYVKLSGMIRDTDAILRPLRGINGGRVMIVMSVVAAALLIAILVGALASM